MIRLDDMDKKILILLQANGKYTIKEISQKLNLSATPIFERIKRLEKSKIIEKYVGIINPSVLGIKLFAFVHISIKEHDKKSVEAFVNQVILFDEVMECHHITGAADFVLKVVMTDIKAYNLFVLDKLSVVPNIGKVESSFSLSVRKYTTEIPIEK